MGTRMAPCNWPVDYAGCVAYAPYFSQPASGIAKWEEMAVEYLWRWTGQSLGTCQVTIRPCGTDCTEGISTFNGFGPFTNGGWGGLWRPVVINGLWYNVSCGLCGDNCSCDGLAAPPINFPDGVIDSIQSIQQDGVILPSTSYRVDNKHLIVRTDGQPWPKCQNMDLPLGQVGTFGITMTLGVPVPVGGQIAAGVLAVELFKASCSDPTCGLPKRIQTVTRQGVTIAMIDNFSDVAKGSTGIWVIDSWIQSMMSAPPRARVYSPDMRRPRRTTSNGPTGFGDLGGRS